MGPFVFMLLILFLFFLIVLSRIGHDNKGAFGGGWKLDNVEIEASGNRKHFPCGRWLDKKEDDGKLERELTPS